MMTINLNDTVRVRLTEHGRAVLRKHIAGLGYESAFYDEKTIDTKDTWQLWELSQIFGPSMFNGCVPVFESTELEVVPSAIADALTVEVRILVRVDVLRGVAIDGGESVEYVAGGWSGSGNDTAQDRLASMADQYGVMTHGPSLTWVTARVPKPAPVAEVAGTVEP